MTNTIDNSVINNDSIQKELIYLQLKDFDSCFKEVGKLIYYVDQLGFKHYYVENGSLECKKIEDSIRIPILNEAINDPSFKQMITHENYNKIQAFNDTIADPISLGYLLSQHPTGQSMLRILTKRGFLNNFSENIQDDDISDIMSEEDYKNYHKVRIHLVNDTLAFFKSADAELCVHRDGNIIYFKYIKQNKWLLDNIVISSKQEEEQYDNKLIGKSVPLTYYKAKNYGYEE